MNVSFFCCRIKRCFIPVFACKLAGKTRSILIGFLTWFYSTGKIGNLICRFEIFLIQYFRCSCIVSERTWALCHSA